MTTRDDGTFCIENVLTYLKEHKNDNDKNIELVKRIVAYLRIHKVSPKQ